MKAEKVSRWGRFLIVANSAIILAVIALLYVHYLQPERKKHQETPAVVPLASTAEVPRVEIVSTNEPSTSAVIPAQTPQFGPMSKDMLSRLDESKRLSKIALLNADLQEQGKHYGLSQWNAFLHKVPLRGLTNLLRADQVNSKTTLSPYGLRIVMSTTDGRYQMIFDAGRIQKVSAMKETLEGGARAPGNARDWILPIKDWSADDAVRAANSALTRLGVSPKDLGVEAPPFVEHPELRVDGKAVSPFWIVRFRDAEGRMPLSVEYRMNANGQGEVVQWSSSGPINVDSNMADYAAVKKQFFLNN